MENNHAIKFKDKPPGDTVNQIQEILHFLDIKVNNW